MLRNGGRFIWFLRSDCFGSYGSGNYVIKDMGGRIDDAFGITPLPMALPVSVSYSPL
jgi:hypothetical protein